MLTTRQPAVTRTHRPDEFSAWINPAPLVFDAARSDPWRRHSINRVDVLLACIFFMTAIAVRWPLIERGETLLHSDEAIVGLMAQDIAEGTRYPIYFYGQRYMGALEAYVIAAISPLFDNPIHALRCGPALFFAALVAVQYLMLASWFGRMGGIVGAAALIFAAPMFAQWSISARGGYIEILLCGTLQMWAYAAWFVEKGPRGHSPKGQEDKGPRKKQNRINEPVVLGRSPRLVHAGETPALPFRRFDVSTFRRLAFGVIIGSGFWINPSIVLFVAPIAAHMLLRHTKSLSEFAIVRRLGVLAMPAIALAGVLLFNCIWSVYVDHGRVHSLLLLGIFPKPIALTAIVAMVAALVFLAHRRWGVLGLLRKHTHAGGTILLGMILGAAPAVWYVISASLGLRPMDPSLPLGLRPLWTIGDTLSYLWHGVPLLFGADARHFLHLVTIGRPSALEPLDIILSGFVLGANLLVLGAALTAVLVLAMTHIAELRLLLRLRNGLYTPAVFLCIGAVGTVALFLLSGAAHDFNTIRYLIPLWAFLPGLLAAVFTQTRFRSAGRLAVLCLLAAWGLGQFAMLAQLGRHHPLRPVAESLVAKKIDPVVAEIFDAHLLSYLTRQACRVVEYQPFWSRLAHYRPAIKEATLLDFLVLTSERPTDLGSAEWRYPGPPPPEVKRAMWPAIRNSLEMNTHHVQGRTTLPSGFEVVRIERARDPSKVPIQPR